MNIHEANGEAEPVHVDRLELANRCGRAAVELLELAELLEGTSDLWSDTIHTASTLVTAVDVLSNTARNLDR